MPVAAEIDHARLVEAIPRHIRKDGTVNYTDLGVEFGLHRSNIRKRVAKLGVAGALGTNPVIPGFGISAVSTQYREGAMVGESIKQRPIGGQTNAVPAGFAIKGVSTLRDAHGNTIVEWTKTREEPDALDYAEMLKNAFVDYEPSSPVSPSPIPAPDDLLTLYPLADMHFGMYAWRQETDANWDLKIAEKTIGVALEKVVARTPRTRQAIVLGGGDQMHSDSNDNKTAKSGNALQVDGRYDKVVGATARFFVRATDLALMKHDQVTVRVLKGNHDEHSSVAIAYFLLAWYRNEPRVKVDVDPSLFWWFPFGKTFLGATHGHEAKPAQMPMIMANRRPEDWGASRFRFIHTFHVHHHEKRATEGDGVILEIHQAPIPQDAWHFGSGFISGRSLQSITYSRETGEVGRSREAIINR